MYGNSTLQGNIIDAQPQRLTPLDLRNKISYSLTLRETVRGESEEVLPPAMVIRDLLESLVTERTLQAQDNVLNNAAIRLGDSLRRTEDELTRNMLAGTAAFVNATGGVNGDMPTEITTPDIDKVTTMLINNNAHMFLSGIEGDLKFGTSPVRMAFIALANSAIIPDLQDPLTMPKFIAKSAYPDQSRTIESEWGAVNNCRFLVSSIGSVTPNSSMNGANVYNIFVVAKEAYGIVEQDQYTAQFLYRPAIYSGPLAQNVTAGYKFGSAYRILNDAWVINLRVTLST